MRKKLLACATAVLFFCNNCYVAMAQTMPMEEKIVEENGQVLYSFYNEGEKVIISSEFDYDDCGTYEKKVFENEVKSQTGIMDAELEVTLNKAGVLDSEIEEMSPETVENLSNATEIQIMSSIYEERGTELVEMKDEEREEYYKEYYNKKYKSKKTKKSVADKVLESIGIKPIEVYATDGERYSYSDTTESAKFKQTLYVCNSKKIDGIHSIYYQYAALWLSTPKYNRLDYIKINIDNGMEFEDMTKYKFSYRKQYCPPTSSNVIITENVVKNAPTNEGSYLGQNSYHVFMQELPGGDNQDSESIKPNKPYCDRQKFYIEGYVQAFNTSKSCNKITFNVEYFHLQVAKKISISSISIGASGDIQANFSVSATVNIDFSSNSYYKSLGVAKLYVNVNYK